MIHPVLSRSAERRIVLDCSALDENAQKHWFQIVATASSLAGVPVRIDLNQAHIKPAALSLLDQLSTEIGQLRYEFIEQVIPPRPDHSFAVIASTDVFSHKLIAGINTIYIEPRSEPVNVNSLLFRYGNSEEILDFTTTSSNSCKDVGLISSVYDADRFITQFLENCSQLHGYEEYEHFLVRPNSPGNEHRKLIEHVRAHPRTAVYINLSQDPGLYNVWNYAVQQSCAKYLSNANVDDQRAPEHTVRLREHLANDNSIDIVSSALRVSKNAAMSWERSGECPTMFSGQELRRYTVEDMFRERRPGYTIRDFPHCMPLWRRRLHVLFGYFNEALYGPSADSEFWIRAGVGEAGYLLDGTPRGLYLKDDQSYWSRNIKTNNYAERVKHSYTGKAEPAPLSMYLDEIRRLYYGAAYLELCGRLISLQKTFGPSSALIDRLCKYYFGSVKELLCSLSLQGTPSQKMTDLHAALHTAADTVEKDEKPAYRIIQGALFDIESMCGY